MEEEELAEVLSRKLSCSTLVQQRPMADQNQPAGNQSEWRRSDAHDAIFDVRMQDAINNSWCLKNNQFIEK